MSSTMDAAVAPYRQAPMAGDSDANGAAVTPADEAKSAEPRPRWLGIAFAAMFLMLSASLANMLSYHGYPAARAEVLILLASFALIALGFAALYRLASDFGRAVLESMLVLLAIDFNSDSMLLAGVAASIVAFVRLGRRLSVLTPLAIVSLVVLVSSLLGLSDRKMAIARTVRPVPAAGAQPAVLHLILDEHGGIGGEADPALKQELTRFYVKHGFRLFERAYSQHFHTVNAIPDVLNFGHPGEGRNVERTLDIGRTAYLSGLERQGYRMNFYQSDFADFCRYANFASCTAYWSPSLEFVEPLPMPSKEKARLIAHKFAALSDTVLQFTAIYDSASHLPPMDPLGLPVLAPQERAKSASLAGFAILDRMASDLRAAEPGNVYFAHVLAPHFPYAANRDCRINAPSRWEYRRSSHRIATREAAYREQVRCVMTKVDRIVTAFRSSEAGRNGVIIIHGDHGSRITKFDPTDANVGKFRTADLMAGYSTLFAVAAPSIEGGLERRPFATPDILRALAQSRFTAMDSLKPGSGQVHLDGSDWAIGQRASIAKAWPAPD